MQKRITCKLGDKDYSIDFVAGRALREIGPADAAYQRIIGAAQSAMEGEEIEIGAHEEEIDALVEWFCILFKNQFTPDEFYDQYPADSMVQDIVTALFAVKSQTTEVLDTFPMTAAQTTTEKKPEQQARR